MLKVAFCSGDDHRMLMLCPMSESLSGKREGFQDNATCKIGKFITDSSQGFCHIPHSGAGSEKAPSPRCYINL